MEFESDRCLAGNPVNSFAKLETLSSRIVGAKRTRLTMMGTNKVLENQASFFH